MLRPALALMVLPLVLAACEPEEIPPDRDDDATPAGSACGAPVTGLEMAFVGRSLLPSGAPAEGAWVALEDRSVTPGIVLGEATVDAEGAFTFDATDITDWPNCWLTLANYAVVAELDALSAVTPVNRDMWDALQDDSMRVDLTSDPITLRR